MKNKKGFTLVELLAVIAILAILILVVMPNILKRFIDAKKSAFIDEGIIVYKETTSRIMTDSLSGLKSEVYDSVNNPLDLSGEELDYCIYVDSQGKVLQMVMNNGSYYMLYDGTKEINKYTKDDAIEYDGTADIRCGVKINVHFETNGANETINDKTLVYNLFYGELPSVTKDHYSFDGWYLSSDFKEENKVNSETRVTTNENHTLYAKWNANSYIVNLDANGGNLSQNSFGTTYLVKPTLSVKPTRTNYYFDGWWTSSTGGYEVFTKDNVVINDVEGFINESGKWINTSDDQKLYAHWQNAKVSDASISNIADYTYTGSEIKPEPVVTLNEYTLIKGVDYTLSYSNNINVGQAMVTIVGIGDFVGTNSKNFTINKANGSVTLSATSGALTTNGSPIGTFSVTSNMSGGSLSVSSNSSTISVSISGSTITWIGSGTTNDRATITVTSEATQNYKSASATFSASYSRDRFFDGDVGTNAEYAYYFLLPRWDCCGDMTRTGPYNSGTFVSRSYNSLKQKFKTGGGADFLHARLDNLEVGHEYILTGTVSQTCSSSRVADDYYLVYKSGLWGRNISESGLSGHSGWAYQDPWNGNAMTSNVWCNNATGNTANPSACYQYNKSITATYSLNSNTKNSEFKFIAKSVNNNFIVWDPWGCNDGGIFYPQMTNLKLYDNTRKAYVRGGN